MKKPDWAKYKREQRKRERDRLLAARDAALPDLRTPFFEYFERERGLNLNEYATVMGDDWYLFDDDSGIKPSDEDALIQEDQDSASNSLGKAELLIGHFIDMATELARLVSDYKRAEIEARLKEAEACESIDDGEIERLKKMRHQLKRQVRWAFPQWKVTGE